MDAAHHVGPGDVEDLVAALEARRSRRAPRSAACSIVPIAPSATSDPVGEGVEERVRRRLCGCTCPPRDARSRHGSRRGRGDPSQSRPRGRTAGADDRTRPGQPERSTTRLPASSSPVMIAAFEGWNDAGRRRHAGARAPGADLGRRRRWPRSTPRTSTTSRSPGRTSAGRRRHPADRVADHPALRWPRRRAPTATSCSSAASSRTCAGARSARELLELRRAARRDEGHHARRAARRHAAHPAHPGQRHVLRQGRRPTRCGVEPSTLRGPDRHRRRAPGRLRARPGSRRSRSGRACRTTSRSPRARRPTLALLHRVEEVLDVEVPLGDAARAGRGVGAHGLARWPRRTTRCASTCAQLEEQAEAADDDDACEGQRRRDRRRLRALPAPPRAGRGLIPGVVVRAAG